MARTFSLDFSSVTISYFVHSTEDEERLLRAVIECFGVGKDEFTTETLEGHYGNKLGLVKAHVIGDHAPEVSKSILLRLDKKSKENLALELERYLDEHDALYLRLDRQEIPERFILGEDEPIRIKMKPKIRGDRSTLIRAYKELMRE